MAIQFKAILLQVGMADLTGEEAATRPLRHQIKHVRSERPGAAANREVASNPTAGTGSGLPTFGQLFGP